MIKRAWTVTAASLPLTLSALTLAGCSLPTAQLTPEQFQAVYAAPRSLTADFTEYRGIKYSIHRLDAYSLGKQSVAHRIGSYTVPVNEMPGDFPQHPQPPISTAPLSDDEMQKWSRAWLTLPRFE